MDYILKKILKYFIAMHLKAKIIKSHQEVPGIMHCCYIMIINRMMI